MQSSPRPQLTLVVRSWEEQAEFAFSLVLQALIQLHMQCGADTDFPDDEKDVSKELGLHLDQLVDQNANANGYPDIPRPNYDGVQGRDLNYDQSREHEDKRPDIRFIIRDAQDENGSHRTLAFECKRLGTSVSGHSLNKDYVEKGIVRFCRQSHRYASASAWGVMIGYIQSSDHNRIFNQVNGHIQNNQIDILTPPSGGWQTVTSQMEHQFDRPFEITPFRLVHLWVDLR